MCKTKLTVLSPETANAFAKAAQKFLALNAKSASRLRALNTQLCLRLTKLTGLQTKLTCQLLGADAHLTGLRRNVCSRLLALKTQSPRLTGQLTGKLRSGHARIGRQLLDIHARLSQSLCVGRSKLLARQAKLTRDLRRLDALLTKLTCARLCQLLGRKTKLRALLRRSHAHLSRLPGKLTLQLSRRHPKLTRQLLGRQSLLTGCRLSRQTKLSKLTGLRCRQLLGRQTKLTRGLRCLKRGARALCAEGPGELCGLLTTRLLGFKGLLRALCCAFKARLTHLSGSPTLLFQHVTRQLGFRNGLARPAKCACANGLRTKLLALDLPLASNIRQSLLHRSIFKAAHERAYRSRIKCTGGPRQTSNPLLGRRSAQSSRFL